MANKLFYFLFILLVGLAACDSPQKEKEETESSALEQAPSEAEENLFATQPMVYDRKADDCADGNCARVLLEYPVFSDNKAANQALTKQINQLLSDFVLEADGGESMETLTEMFLRSYGEFKAAFPESKTPWSIKLNAEISYRSSTFASVGLTVDSYTGGAHPNSTTTFVNLSPKGKTLDDLSFFFSDETALRALAEQQFRKDQKMNPAETYSDRGFLFDDDAFSLPDNFGFNQRGVVFHYNAYDIAPYSEGPLVLTLTFAQLGSLYRF